MTGCEEIQKRLIAHSEGELRADERRRVEAHLATCVRCARDAVLVREALGWVQTFPVPQPPAGFWEAFEAAVRRRIAEERPPRPARLVRLADWLDRLPWLRPVSALAAATALGLLLAIGLVRTERGGREVPPVEALAFSEELGIGQDLEVLKQLDLLEEVEVLERLPLLQQLNGGRRPLLG